MAYNIKKYDKYNKIIIISLKENNYEVLLNILLKLKIIKFCIIQNNFIWNVDDTCLVYNIGNTTEKNKKNISNLSKIIKLFNILLKNIGNNKIIIISKKHKNIYCIGNNIFLHSSIVKKILKLPEIQNILENYKNIDNNIYSIINEIIRLKLLKLIKYEKITNISDNKIKNKINSFIQKEKHKDKRLESIKYLNNLCILNNYKKNNKLLYNIDTSNENIFDINNKKKNLIYEIINDNQILNVPI